MKLNPAQDEAVRYISGPLLVLAGAGSGKTRVITQKIAHLIHHCGYQARHIAAVTFTNKAAREMKERVGGLIGGREASGLTVSTFHNLGLNFIRKELKHLGMKPGFSVFDDQDSLLLLKELTHSDLSANKDELQALSGRISNWKNDLVLPEQALREARDESDYLAAEVYAAYSRHLRAYNAVDFDDLILVPTLMLQADAEARERWQNRIRYLLVDEYQDTNTSQYLLVKLLAGVRAAFTVVGDDDQSIYSWRGAKPQNLVLLNEDFPALKLIKLEQNYRSVGRVLKAANTLIANNPHVFEKRLWSDMGYGLPLRVLQCRSEEHEAERVAAEILNHHFQHQSRYSDYAILYRGNHQARAFEKALMEAGVPYKLSGGTSFFARAEIKDVMAYLRVLINPIDDNAFLRIVNTPRRELGPSTLEKLGTYANEHQLSMYQASFEPGLEEPLNGRQLEALRIFTEMLADTAERVQREDPIPVLEGLLKRIAYEEYLYDNASSPKIAEFRWKNVQTLLLWITELIGKDPSGETDLAAAVNKMVLRDMLERLKDDEDVDEVQLLTLHAAKGLEYPHVYMVGMEEEILPHKTSIENDDIEEERRLTYVGITRARETLTFTMAALRKRYGEQQICEPSRFLSELPADDLDWEKPQAQQDPDKRRETARSRIAGLRGMLDLG
ncbi:MAG: DNA helicase Rep [Gammaproteobacteria bacterium]|nr:DNA helicase Rep [Gammaproteobacteria bacterium]